MKWHTRDILAGQQKEVEVIGPLTEEGLDEVVVGESEGYWRGTRL